MIGRKDRRPTFQDVRKVSEEDGAFPGVEVGDVVRITGRGGGDFAQITVVGRDLNSVWGTSGTRHCWEPQKTIVQKVMQDALPLPVNDYAIIEDPRDNGRRLYVHVGGRWVTFRAGVDVEHAIMQMNICESGYIVVTDGAITYPDIADYDSRMSDFERLERKADAMIAEKEAKRWAKRAERMKQKGESQ